MDRIVFTGDLLRTYGEVGENPQAANVDWLKSLLGPLIEDCLGVQAQTYYGTTSDRSRWYRSLGVPFSVPGWASIYSALSDADVEAEIADRFAGSFVVGFELPPYLIKILNKRKIAFVDTGIHPIRYLSDYILAVRSNDTTIMRRFGETQLNSSVFKQFARISLARSAKTFRNRSIKNNSALFLGQVDADTSLISAGKMRGDEEATRSIIGILSKHEHLYYKFHPHRKHRSKISEFINNVRRCSIIDANIYDAFSLEEISVVASLSSGALEEAKYFGKKTLRVLPDALEHFDATERDRVPQYVPAPPAVVAQQYWRHALCGESGVHLSAYDPPHPIKYSLNQKWGR